MKAKFLVISLLIQLSCLLSSIVMAAGGEQGAEHHGNPTPGVDLIFREFNFILLIAILFFLLRKPIKEYFAARAAAIRASVEESQKAHQEAKKHYEELNKRLQGMDQETKNLVESFRKEGKLERDKLIEQAQNYAEKIKEDAKKIADNELKKAKEELKETAIAISKDLAQKSIKNEITDDDQERLSKSFVDRLKRLH